MVVILGSLKVSSFLIDLNGLLYYNAVILGSCYKLFLFYRFDELLSYNGSDFPARRRKRGGEGGSSV